MKYEDLIKHLYYLKNMPDAVPYKTSYYEKNWGFCLSYNDFKKLDKIYERLKNTVKITIKDKTTNIKNFFILLIMWWH